MSQKKYVIENIDVWKDSCIDIGKKIWEHPELAYEEYFASKLQAETLEKQGFSISKIPGVETAFVAEYGSGKPIIGIAGEYDALPGYEQEAVPYRSFSDTTKPGHACGHNLIGAGGMLAALAVKDAIQEGKLIGTIRYYGCPAEEGGGGKIKMIDAGVFDDLDCALHWHPDCLNRISRNIFLSKCSLIVTFEGTNSPTLAKLKMAGDTAQAAELANMGVQYLYKYFDKSMVEGHFLREGAASHNVLPVKTEVLYGIRADNQDLLKLLIQRVTEIAEGAAKMTGTKVSCCVENFYTNELYLDSLADLIYQNMKDIPRPEYTSEEIAFAEELGKTGEAKFRKSIIEMFNIKAEDLKGSMYTGTVKCDNSGHRPSSDFANVTCIVPGAMFFAAIVPVGFTLHSWQATSCTGMSIGMQGMVYAAKVLAGTICDLMETPSYLNKIREEFETKNERSV